MSEWNLYWHLTLIYVMLPTAVIWLGLSLWRIFRCMQFNYHFYIQHGEFVILPPQNGTMMKSHVVQLANEKDIDQEDASWVMVLFECFVLALIFQAGAFLWPITSIVVMPMVLVWLVSYRKRKKVVFVQKLQGNKVPDQDR